MAVSYPLGNTLDNQVFEYTDTLSFEIPDGQRHLKVGQPVLISKTGGVAGILMTDIRPGTESFADRVDVLRRPTYGHNGPNYASVRVKNGVFRVKGTSKAGVKAGDPVYLKATTGNTGEPKVILDKMGADVRLGTLYAAPKSPTGDQELLVIIDPAVVGA